MKKKTYAVPVVLSLDFVIKADSEEEAEEKARGIAEALANSRKCIEDFGFIEGIGGFTMERCSDEEWEEIQKDD